MATWRSRVNVSSMRRAGRRSFATALACLLIAVFCVPALSADDPDNRFLSAAQDRTFIMRALERERMAVPPQLAVTGVTVPHHLLAADLIARGILAASGGTYERVLILSPDHFRALKTPFGITTGDLPTVMGELPADRALAEKILRASPLFADVGTVPREHGVHAVSPFVRAVFPRARVVAITTATNSTPADWREAAELLSGLVGRETLIVQSTDFSHFLPVATAVLRDQETLAALASGDPDAVLPLTQPAHLDSKASQFIQTALQRKLHGAAPIIIANRNANEYSPTHGPTTSYVVMAFTPQPDQGWRLGYSDQHVMYFGGDVYLGRGWTQPLMRPDTADWLAAQIKNLTGGHPLAINLEGVVLEEDPAGANGAQHLMLARLAMPVLGRLGVTAANLANNHAYDFGEAGFDETTRLLDAVGIKAVHHAALADLGGAKVLPLTFKRGYFFDHPVIRSLSQLDPVCASQGASPLIVLPHWGGDYTAVAQDFESQVLDKLATCGVSAVIGAHSHQASSKVELRAGGALQSVFSMGNLIFDQSGPAVSGSLVELRVFRQGTITLRIIPVPNLFESVKSR